jgi:hypothetical protein
LIKPLGYAGYGYTAHITTAAPAREIFFAMCYNFIVMIYYFNTLKKLVCFSLMMILCLPVTLLADGQSFVVKPVELPQEARLLASQAWPGGSSQEELIFKLAYLRGLLDAWQISSMAPQAAREVLSDLAGLSLQDLAAAVDAYYEASPANRGLPPGSVILRAIAPYRGKDKVKNE